MTDADRPPGDRGSSSAQYAVLVVVGIAIGWFEAAVVIDLRALFYPAGFQFPVETMPARLLAVEIVREACSLVMLAGIGYLASPRRAGRIGAFILLFGVWDLVYYAVLKLVLDWPESLATWDLLFLIPLPWLGPVWAPVLVAAAFVVIGTRLVRTSARVRRYTTTDVALIVIGAVAVVVSFIAEWRAVAEQRLPGDFRAWLFWIGVLLGTWAFWRAERRTATSPPEGLLTPP